MMKDLLWAESQKLHRSKILWIAGFATVMVNKCNLSNDLPDDGKRKKAVVEQTI